MSETEVMSGNVKDIVNRLSRDMTNRAPFSIHLQNERKQPTLFIGSFAYAATQPDELSFGVGDIIELIEEVEDGWSKGRLKSTGAIGMFPTNFVTLKTVTTTTTRPKTTLSSEVIMRNEPKAIERTPSTVLMEPSSILKSELKANTISPSSSSITDSGTETIRMKEMARVKFVYTPQHNDELALNDLDVLINIINKNCGDAGWFEGELMGKNGLFPDNFVELVQVPLTTESGTKFASLSMNRNQSLADKISNKPPPANPPQPAIPPKPAKMKIETAATTSTSSTIPPSNTATATTASTTGSPKNAFAALREKMSTNLKVVAPDQLAAAQQQKSVELKDRSSSVETYENRTDEVGAEPTFDINSTGDQVSELQHITKSRARPAKSRPMSMVMNRNRSSDESPGRINSAISSTTQNTMTASMFVTPTAASSSSNTTPFKNASPTPIAPPSSTTKPALRPIISSTTEPSEPLKTDNNASEYVTRAEYDALLDRVRVLEARLIAMEKLRL